MSRRSISSSRLRIRRSNGLGLSVRLLSSVRKRMRRRRHHGRVGFTDDIGEGELLSSVRAVVRGNLDLRRRAVVVNRDGSISTELWITMTDDVGHGILIPRIVGGRCLTIGEAVAHFHRSGEHLGIFKDIETAKEYGELLDLIQERRYNGVAREQRS